MPLPVIALFGPTAVGKTSVAIELADLLRQRGERPTAVSVDSIAVYRQLPIISGAPSRAEQSRLEHQLVGIKDVTEEFSAGECAELAHALIDERLATGHRVIVVGGTGLYMRSALSELDLRQPVATEIRERWQARLTEQGAESLRRQLSALNPEAAARINPADGRRITRALELIESGGEPPAHSAGLWSAKFRHPTVSVGLIRSDDELKGRIRTRAEAMIASGGPAEVMAAESIGAAATARAAVGWEELKSHDSDLLTTRTWQLARRQRTWLRRMHGFVLVDITGLSPIESARQVLASIDRAEFPDAHA